MNSINMLHGYKSASDIAINNKVTNSISNIVALGDRLPSKIDFSKERKSTVKKNTKKFMNELFNIHDIGYCPDWLVMKICHNENINSLDELLKLYNESAYMVEPFKLPIKYMDRDPNYGKLICQLLCCDDKKELEYILKKINTFYIRIELSKITTPISEVTYIHELTHTQVDSIKGSISDYINKEVLSIFLELLYASNNQSLLNFIILKRTNHLAVSYSLTHAYEYCKDHAGMKEEEYYDNISYVTGITEAFNMLEIYIYGSNIQKKYMLDCVQDVFDGKITVEECLDKIGINFEDSLDEKYVRKLIKEN